MISDILKGSVVALTAAVLLTGCGGDREDVIPATYEVSITNLTNFQPLSPIGLIIDEDAKFFEVGQSASLNLEKLAEGGDNSALLSSKTTTVSTDGPVLPGETVVLTIDKGRGHFEFSAAAMLVNTNDGFTGVNGYNLDDLDSGESVSFYTNAYDAGTEANSELAGTIPGPADGGEGFNEIRDDANVVRMHSGVVTKDDGLDSSVLTEQAKFDNAVMRVILKRIK